MALEQIDVLSCDDETFAAIADQMPRVRYEQIKMERAKILAAHAAEITYGFLRAIAGGMR